MKALTIHQPFAQFIANGQKRYETRSWRTHYRGPLAIHASKNRTETLYSGIALNGPFGAIIAVAELVDCYSTKYLTMFREDDIAAELNIGDFSPDRWAWELRNVILVDTPIFTRGYQGLWEYRGDML